MNMNMQQLLAQSQRMQKEILNKKSKIDAMEFVGKSEWVEIKFKGNRDVVSVDILNDEAFAKENKEVLCDMIELAIKDGLKKINNETESAFGQFSNLGGLF